jgi:hypothetical protein
MYKNYDNGRKVVVYSADLPYGLADTTPSNRRWTVEVFLSLSLSLSLSAPHPRERSWAWFWDVKPTSSMACEEAQTSVPVVERYWTTWEPRITLLK